jgi:hypothetical protein
MNVPNFKQAVKVCKVIWLECQYIANMTHRSVWHDAPKFAASGGAVIADVNRTRDYETSVLLSISEEFLDII